MTKINLKKAQYQQLLALEADQELSLLVPISDDYERGQKVQLTYGRGKHYKEVAEAVLHIKRVISYRGGLVYSDVVPLSMQGTANVCYRLGLNIDEFLKTTTSKTHNYIVLANIALVGEEV